MLGAAAAAAAGAGTAAGLAGGSGAAQAQAATPSLSSFSAVSPPPPAVLNYMVSNFTTMNVNGVSSAELAILRLIATNSSFRASFNANPTAAINSSGVRVTSGELLTLSSITTTQIAALTSGIANFSAADGTNTLAYAIVLAIVIALLIEIPASIQAPVA